MLKILIKNLFLFHNVILLITSINNILMILLHCKQSVFFLKSIFYKAILNVKQQQNHLNNMNFNSLFADC